jgi:hypothetical protein
MAILLPVQYSVIGSELWMPTIFFPVFSGQDYSDVVQELASVAGAKHDEITVYYQRDNTRDIIRMVDSTDLIFVGAICLKVFVGLPPGTCKVCDKGCNYCFIPEFHCCVEDKPIVGFKSQAGPVERPSRRTVT